MVKHEPPKTITKNQYYQLLGLKAAAKRQIDVLDAIKEAALEITDERDHEGKREDSGHTMDMIWQSREIDEALEIMGIAVSPAG